MAIPLLALRVLLYILLIPSLQIVASFNHNVLLFPHHFLRQRRGQDYPFSRQNKSIVLMAPIRHTPINARLSNASVQDLQYLQNRIERRRPKPKSKHRPEYYQNLIQRHDIAKIVIKNRYSDTIKDNLSGIQGKFIK
jgi:hypothetical protein